MVPKEYKLVHHFLEGSANTYPNKTALVHDDIRADFSEINSKANQLALWLKEHNVNRGDRVVMILDNCLEYVVSYYGALKAGAVIVPLLSDMKPQSLRLVLTELEAKVIISGRRFEKLLSDTDLSNFTFQTALLISPKMDWSSLPFPVYQWEDVINNSNASNTDFQIEDSSLASIIYTSGSTGKPKGVMLTHGNILANTRSICLYLNLTHNDIQMVVLPFFYVMGKSLLNTHYAVGGTVVLNNKFAYPATVINQMIKENVTGFSGVPSTYAYLLHRSPLRKRRDELHSLRYCSQAGGHMSKQIKNELREVLPPHTDLVVMYGATEASARLSYLEPEKLNEKIESIGKAIPDVELKIIGPDGCELPIGEVGEVVGSGANIMQGYWRDEKATSAVLDHNGYHTGDLGYKDEDGYIFLVGRKDNMLKVSGHRINTQEIEDALMETGLVVETVVFGVPDKLLGNRLIAVGVPINENIQGNDIIDKSSENLSKFKVPSEFVIVKSLPKNPSGKINKEKSTELALSNLSLETIG